MNNYQQNIFITGASGFIGTALLEKLLKSALPDQRFILLTRNKIKVLNPISSNLIWIEGDINNFELICSVIKEYEIHIVYHLATPALIHEYYNNPYNSYIDSLMGQVTLLEAIRKNGMKNIKKIIILTSYKVYGNSQNPINEKSIFSPQNPYETAKCCQDLISKDYFNTYGLPINIIRACNIFGPFDKNIDRLIPKTIQLIKDNKQPEVYQTVKNNKREYLYIDDAIEALILICKNAPIGEDFCLSGDIYLSIEEIINQICILMNFKNGFLLVNDNIYSSESKEHKINNNKLLDLGWVPKFDFSTGISKCIF